MYVLKGYPSIDFIEAVTFYHQYQRTEQVDESTGEIYIETTIEDIAEANKLMKEILLRKSDQLNGACRNYFEQLKKHIEQAEQKTFTNRMMGDVFRIAHSTVKRHHYELHQAGLIKLNQDKKTKTFWYELLSTDEYQLLQQKITNVLDNVLKNIATTLNTKKEIDGSDQLTKQPKPIKPSNSKANKEQPNKNEEDNEGKKNDDIK